MVLAGVVLLMLLVAVLGLTFIGREESEERFCTADGMLGPNGETYGRDPNQGCKFVDDDGNVLPDQ